MHDDTISEDTLTAVDLIRSLVETYIDHPEALVLNVRDYGDQVYFTAQGHSDDHKRLVGTGGAHVAALEHLVKAMGRARQVVHSFRLLNPEPSGRREDYEEKDAETHDPEPAEKLLRNLIRAVGIDEVSIVVSMRSLPDERPLSYLFQVYTRTEDDHEALIVSPRNARNGLTAVAAIGTLFRAAARKAGVKYTIEAVKP